MTYPEQQKIRHLSECSQLTSVKKSCLLASALLLLSFEINNAWWLENGEGKGSAGSAGSSGSRASWMRFEFQLDSDTASGKSLNTSELGFLFFKIKKIKSARWVIFRI